MTAQSSSSEEAASSLILLKKTTLYFLEELQTKIAIVQARWLSQRSGAVKPFN